MIVYLLEPDMFTARNAFVSVVTDSGPTHGQTVADWRGQIGEMNAKVMVGIDAERFYTVLTERLARL